MHTLSRTDLTTTLYVQWLRAFLFLHTIFNLLQVYTMLCSDLCVTSDTDRQTEIQTFGGDHGPVRKAPLQFQQPGHSSFLSIT